jgi:hypothetical protein
MGKDGGEEVKYGSSYARGKGGVAATDAYFGGEDNPDGPGHGHIKIDEHGNVLHAREADRYGGGVSEDDGHGSRTH